MADPENRRRKNAGWRRRMRANKAARARKRQQSRAWRKEHPDRVKKHKRRYLLQQSPTYLATQRRHNADPVRAEKKRAAARARYYELHPVRPTPVCTACGEAIAWTGRGRPPKYHLEHSPWKKQRKDYRPEAA
jgi:hypothetical protein